MNLNLTMNLQLITINICNNNKIIFLYIIFILYMVLNNSY